VRPQSPARSSTLKTIARAEIITALEKGDVIRQRFIRGQDLAAALSGVIGQPTKCEGRRYLRVEKCVIRGEVLIQAKPQVSEDEESDRGDVKKDEKVDKWVPIPISLKGSSAVEA